MATGVKIHKNQKSISAWKRDKDFFSLPDNAERAFLTYKGKLQQDLLFQKKDKEFLEISCEKGVKKAQIVPCNSFTLGDNLHVLNQLILQKTKADLIYLDPPYCTGFDFQSRGLEHSYEDNMGQAEYIEFMRRRLILIRECLSDSGSVYVHIGHQMLGHVKVVMDEIFGSQNCRNIITRRKCSSKNFTKKQYSNINDFILFYTKGKNYIWNQPGLDPDEEWVKKEYPKIDEYGRKYKLVPIHAPGIRNGETGGQWRGMMPPSGKHWQYSPSKLEEMDKNGDIHWSCNGNPRRKVYLDNNKKLPLTDYWEKYRDAHHQSVKITGYPTEKNLDMLKMIVSASSNEESIVIDPFCGSGSFLHAARDLNRKYFGIDSSFSSAETTIKRMKYGLQKMGDYVVKKKESDSSESKNNSEISLLEPCKFLVDKELYNNYQREMNKILAFEPIASNAFSS